MMPTSSRSMLPRYMTLCLILAALLTGCSAQVSAEAGESLEKSLPAPEELGRATFAGGCFWCMEQPFDVLDGVVSTTSGYIGGHQADPSYKQVSAGRTGHTEAVEVLYDADKISYQELLEVFWHNIDPTVANRQFCDAGSQYRSGIFYHDESQKQLAEASKQALVDSGRLPRVVTEVTAASRFYAAEDYHQDFYRKNPVRYKTYRFGCRRDQRLQELWGAAAGH